MNHEDAKRIALAIDRTEADLRGAEVALRAIRVEIVREFGLLVAERGWLPDDKEPALQSDLAESPHKQKTPAKAPEKNAGAPSDRLGF